MCLTPAPVQVLAAPAPAAAVAPPAAPDAGAAPAEPPMSKNQMKKQKRLQL
jgi:hypothetical protein